MSPDASFCVSVGQDRTLRMWSRSDDLVFVEEERERALEAKADAAAASSSGGVQMIGGMEAHEGELVASKPSLESVRGGELLMEALDLAEAELALMKEAEERARALGIDVGVSDGKHGGGKNKNKGNPLLLGLHPHAFMIRSLRSIKAPELEQALLVLPFHYVTRLIAMLLQLAKKGLDLELCCRSAVFLLRCHFQQITAARALLPEVAELQAVLRGAVGSYTNLLGTNLAGLQYLGRAVAERKAGSSETMSMTMTIPGATGDSEIGKAQKKRKKSDKEKTYAASSSLPKKNSKR